MRLTGLIAAPHTPFAPDGKLNLAGIPAQCELHVESGLTGVFVCGSTGEGMSLSAAERTAVAEAWVKAAAGRLKVIVHVGHHAPAEAAVLAAHAQSVGAAAVSAVAPSYFKPATPADVAAALAPVAAAAPKLPFYFYDIPIFTGVNLPAAEVLDELAARVPNVAGAKFTNPDLMSLQECLALRGGEFDIVFGLDEMLLAALALGVKGAVGSTYNLAAPVYHRVMKAFAAGDLDTARREQLKSVRLIRGLIRNGGVIPASKAIMGWLGADCGPVRPPLRPLSATDAAGLRAAIGGLDIYPRPLAG